MDQLNKKTVACYAYCTKEHCKYIVNLYVLVAINPFRENKEAVRYSAQCYYERKYKNFWTLNIIFTKLLNANFKVFYKYIMQILIIIYFSMLKKDLLFKAHTTHLSLILTCSL